MPKRSPPTPPTPARPAAPALPTLTDLVRARFATLMGRLELTQKALGKDIARDQSSISLILAGKRRYDGLEVWRAIAHRLGYPLSELIAEAEERLKAAGEPDLIWRSAIDQLFETHQELSQSVIPSLTRAALLNHTHGAHPDSEVLHGQPPSPIAPARQLDLSEAALDALVVRLSDQILARVLRLATPSTAPTGVDPRHDPPAPVPHTASDGRRRPRRRRR